MGLAFQRLKPLATFVRPPGEDQNALAWLVVKPIWAALAEKTLALDTPSCQGLVCASHHCRNAARGVVGYALIGHILSTMMPAHDNPPATRCRRRHAPTGSSTTRGRGLRNGPKKSGDARRADAPNGSNPRSSEKNRRPCAKPRLSRALDPRNAVPRPCAALFHPCAGERMGSASEKMGCAAETMGSAAEKTGRAGEKMPATALAPCEKIPL